MDQPRAFSVENVRCFAGNQRADLRPITLLVGENSTGKTTFLGCYGVLHRFLYETKPFGDNFDFNREPFSMGSFREIVRSRRGRAGRIDKFELGLEIVPDKAGHDASYHLKITFAEERSQPIVSSVTYWFGESSFVTLERSSEPRKTVIVCPRGKAEFRLAIDEHWWFFGYVIRNREREYPDISSIERKIIDYVSDILQEQYGNGHEISVLDMMNRQFPRIIPVAPLRSKPKRTYDPVRETESPEGEHIPMLMMRLDRTDKRGWNTLHDDLTTFGQASGLFSDIVVRRHGKQMSDPFQLQVKVRSGSRSNIMDVGYGVSQSLPILVDVRNNRRSTFLMQQPEVHLHPRAQAELADLFVESFSRNENRFLVETHSDYIVDRIRILIKRGAVSPDDVSILYFAPKGNTVAINGISLDEDGNLQNVPKGYRDFFVRESDRLLGFSD